MVISRTSRDLAFLRAALWIPTCHPIKKSPVFCLWWFCCCCSHAISAIKVSKQLDPFGLSHNAVKWPGSHLHFRCHCNLEHNISPFAFFFFKSKNFDFFPLIPKVRIKKLNGFQSTMCSGQSTSAGPRLPPWLPASFPELWRLVSQPCSFTAPAGSCCRTCSHQHTISSVVSENERGAASNS